MYFKLIPITFYPPYISIEIVLDTLLLQMFHFVKYCIPVSGANKNYNMEKPFIFTYFFFYTKQNEKEKTFKANVQTDFACF